MTRLSYQPWSRALWYPDSSQCDWRWWPGLWRCRTEWWWSMWNTRSDMTWGWRWLFTKARRQLESCWLLRHTRACVRKKQCDALEGLTRTEKNVRAHTSDNSPTDLRPSFSTWWSSKQGFKTLYNCSVFRFANPRCISTHFPSTSFHVVGPRNCFCESFFPHPGSLSGAPAEIRDSTFLCISLK